MDRLFLAEYWMAWVYEQQENQTHDVNFLLDTLKRHLGDVPLRILEVACGGGRICVPLAQAGYDVVGFDRDSAMLLRCYRRMRDLSNLRIFQADALTADWGRDYDVVVLAGNLLINIESKGDYAEAQQIFLQKAAQALKPGGHLYLDFDLHANPSAVFNRLREGHYFDGTDDLGTSGRTVSYGSVYDPVTQIAAGSSHVEITTNNGERIVVPEVWHKHIPTLEQVTSWLRASGLTPEAAYANFTHAPLPDPLDETMHRATIWARKD